MTNIATLNAGARRQLGYGLVHDVVRPVDMEQLRTNYRNHKIALRDNDASADLVAFNLEPAPVMRNYLVPVRISRTLHNPLKPSRAIEFYVKVLADDVEMAAHLAGSIVRRKWATPQHSTNISLNGAIAL